MEYGTADIRRFLVETFSDEELKILCFDYFRDVYDDFTTGMTKGRMIQLLIERCVRRGALPNLDAALAAERPAQYATRFGAPEPAGLPAEPRPGRPRSPAGVHQPRASGRGLCAPPRGRPASAGWRLDRAREHPAGREVGRGDRPRAGRQRCLPRRADAGGGRTRGSRKKRTAAVALEVRGEVHFVPLDVEACAVPTLWNGYQRVPFRGRYEDGLRELLGRLNGVLGELGDSAAARPPNRRRATALSS